MSANKIKLLLDSLEVTMKTENKTEIGLVKQAIIDEYNAKETAEDFMQEETLVEFMEPIEQAALEGQFKDKTRDLDFSYKYGVGKHRDEGKKKMVLYLNFLRGKIEEHGVYRIRMILENILDEEQYRILKDVLQDEGFLTKTLDYKGLKF